MMHVIPCVFINKLKSTVEGVRGLREEVVEGLHCLRNTVRSGNVSLARPLSPLLPDQEARAAALKMGGTR